MEKNDFPETYCGYKTSELLEMWDLVSAGGLKEELDVPPQKMIAMRNLVREFRLSPVARIAAGMIKLDKSKD